jgi:general secretion pathway protein G
MFRRRSLTVLSYKAPRLPPSLIPPPSGLRPRPRRPAGARRPSLKMKPPPNRRAAGFTLLELLVVMVIIGMLAGFVAPKFFSQIGKSEVKTARAQIDALEKALDQYRLDVGRYPASEPGLAALNERPAAEPRWAGPYLKKAVPLDPWGRAYVYKYPGEHGEYDLLSYGKDGQPGGNVVAEALASGLATVAYRSAAAAELIQDGFSGRTAPPGDAYAFSAAALGLALDAGLRRAVGQRARLDVEARGWPAVVERFESVLRQAARKAS